MTEEELKMEKYLALMAAKAEAGQVDSPDMVGDEVEQDTASNYAMKAQADQAKLDQLAASSGQASGQLSKVGGAATTGGAAAGNPYVMGAGLALSTLGQVDDAKRGAEQAKIDAYNKKIMAKRSAIRNIFA